MKSQLILTLLIVLVTIANAQNQVAMNINQEAPVVQSNEILINASSDKIWEILVDITNWPNWNNKISNSKLATDVSQGSTFTWKINGSKIKSKIHTCKPNQTLGWTGRAFGAKAIHNWNLESTDQGVIVKVEESMEGWLIALLRKKMNSVLKEDMSYWLEQLKIECEK